MRGSFAECTTFGIGGPIRRLLTASSVSELAEYSYDAVVIGGGSNVLASDDGYDGTVVLNRYASVFERDGLTVAGSGTRLTALCRCLEGKALTGLEWAVGIPGTVGGAVKMNAGAFGSCIADTIVYADVLRCGRLVRLYRDELCFGYRQSAITGGDVVIEAAFKTARSSARAVRERMRQAETARRITQPAARSAGSVFKNPPGLSVGRLIDDAGLKGYRVGGAKISEVHANIIVNIGGATAKDVTSIIKTVKQELMSRYGAAVQEEIVYIGKF